MAYESRDWQLDIEFAKSHINCIDWLEQYCRAKHIAFAKGKDTGNATIMDHIDDAIARLEDAKRHFIRTNRQNADH